MSSSEYTSVIFWNLKDSNADCTRDIERILSSLKSTTSPTTFPVWPKRRRQPAQVKCLSLERRPWVSWIPEDQLMERCRSRSSVQRQVWELQVKFKPVQTGSCQMRKGEGDIPNVSWNHSFNSRSTNDAVYMALFKMWSTAHLKAPRTFYVLQIRKCMPCLLLIDKAD